ncbi:hypothetical protein Y032_0329g2680 [Ancylostoma ceylanicum]|uniref:Uncharacterized protein n=1 Tax=Ancylostoma ceylanicum TaxID=53326 RepID=A0A016RZT6_9BILA|nr:hypothetical protein Y032_0329g2680 [Ancylostoma ceylanicum]
MADGGSNDEVPMEPEEQNLQGGDQPNAQQAEAPAKQRNQQQTNELNPMHRKFNRLLEKSDEMQLILTSTHGMIHTMDQRTITSKNLQDTTLDGLEKLFDLHKNLLQELQDQGVFKDKNNASPKPKPSRSPSRGPSRAQVANKSRRCPVCDGDHYASDCTKVTLCRRIGRKRGIGIVISGMAPCARI